MNKPLSPLQCGRILTDRYRLEAPIGRGSMGEVWRARDLQLGVDVALKFLRKDRPDKLGQALRHEARELLRLDHPNICPAYRLATMDGFLVLVLEYLEGTDLNRLRKAAPGRRLDLGLVVRTGLDAAAGLTHAHLKGIDHNDVKPGNLLLHEDGRIMLLDFGLSRLSESEVLGTPAYMDAHRAETGEAAHTSDVYGLASTLYTLATGVHPFGRGVGALARSLQEPVPESEWLPADLHALLADCMAPNLDDRPPLPVFRARLLGIAGRLGLDVSAHAQDLQDAPPSTDARAIMAGVADAHGELPADAMTIVPRSTVIVDGKRVQVPSFLIGLYPVTNRDYAAFVADTGREPPTDWHGPRPPTGRAMHPVTGVDMEDARAFATWMGARLPTSEEWLSALRGPNTRTYPWGRTCDPSLCNCPLSESAADTRPVDREVRASTLEGVWDLLGNVWEWTSSVPRAKPDHAVVVGGSFRTACGLPSGRFPRAAMPASSRRNDVGFRLARSL